MTKPMYELKEPPTIRKASPLWEYLKGKGVTIGWFEGFVDTPVTRFRRPESINNTSHYSGILLNDFIACLWEKSCLMVVDEKGESLNEYYDRKRQQPDFDRKRRRVAFEHQIDTNKRMTHPDRLRYARIIS